MHTPMATSKRGGRQGGFTLIELMVGMLLALITTVIIAEVMTKSEGNRRTTTEGSDAQVNGSLALYAMQRDIQMAGYGIVSNPGVLGCPVKGQYGNNAAPNPLVLAPVKIDVSGTAGTSDTVTVLHTDISGYAVPIITSAAHGSADTAFVVQSSLGISEGDMMIAMPSSWDSNNWCTIFTVKSPSAGSLTATAIPHATASNSWNPSASNMPSTYASGSTLVKVASAPGTVAQTVYRSYTTNTATGNLEATNIVTDTDAGGVSTIGTQIVLMKAYYGRDTDGDGVVDTYDTSTPATNAAWKTVKTIRVALVARSGQREKDLVTTSNPVWTVGTTAAPAAAATCGTNKCITLQIDPGTGDTEWKHYRYKVFDTVIPLRNMFWSS